MHFIVDEQLPRRLASWLSARPSCSARHALDLNVQSDEAIARVALTGSAVIVTKDADFVALGNRHAVPGVWLRYGNCSNDDLIARLGRQFDVVAGMLADGERLIELY